MELMHKLLFRRFSAEEFKQFREIYQEETKKLRKRIQFIVGLILLAALMFYFLFRAFGFRDIQWPSTGDVVGCVAGVTAGVFTAWLLCRWFKLNKLFKTYMLILFGVFFLIFQFLIVSSNSKAFEWEYLVYTLIILTGFICINDSIREYFCERLLREQQKQH